MKETNYWQQFTSTGKVEDYLQYRQEVQENSDQRKLKEDSPYAGLYNNYRDGSEDGANRRI